MKQGYACWAWFEPSPHLGLNMKDPIPKSIFIRWGSIKDGKNIENLQELSQRDDEVINKLTVHPGNQMFFGLDHTYLSEKNCLNYNYMPSRLHLSPCILNS